MSFIFSKVLRLYRKCTMGYDPVEVDTAINRIETGTDNIDKEWDKTLQKLEGVELEIKNFLHHCDQQELSLSELPFAEQMKLMRLDTRRDVIIRELTDYSEEYKNGLYVTSKLKQSYRAAKTNNRDMSKVVDIIHGLEQGRTETAKNTVSQVATTNELTTDTQAFVHHAVVAKEPTHKPTEAISMVLAKYEKQRLDQREYQPAPTPHTTKKRAHAHPPKQENFL